MFELLSGRLTNQTRFVHYPAVSNAISSVRVSGGREFLELNGSIVFIP